MDFSDDERLFLQTVCRYFHDHAEWPTYDYLDRILSKDREDFLVERVGKKLEPFMYQGAGWYVPSRGWEPEARASLTISAIYACYTEGICPELVEDLDAFIPVVRLCIEKHRTRTETNPQVTAAEVRDQFAMSDLMLHKVFELLTHAGLTYGSAYTEPGNWTITVSPELRYYRHLHMATMDDFISIRKRIQEDQRVSQPVTPSTPAIQIDPSAFFEFLRASAESSRAPAAIQLHPISLFPPGPFTHDEHLCFVLMPFASELLSVYDDAIMPAVTKMKLKCVRADELSKPGGIMAQVWEQLMRARVVVADLTNMNANVFYELGLAHTIGHDAILLTQDMKWVPFDLRHMRCIVYQQDSNGLQFLTQKLRAALRAVLAEPEP